MKLASYFKQPKFKNKKQEYDGHSFPSRGHTECYQLLKLMEHAGEIRILKCEDNIYLTDARILYIADFKIFDCVINKEVWVEYKGFETPVWRIKRRLWAHYGPGPLRVYKSLRGKNAPILLVEEIVPK